MLLSARNCLFNRRACRLDRRIGDPLKCRRWTRPNRRIQNRIRLTSSSFLPYLHTAHGFPSPDSLDYQAQHTLEIEPGKSGRYDGLFLSGGYPFAVLEVLFVDYRGRPLVSALWRRIIPGRNFPFVNLPQPLLDAHHWAAFSALFRHEPPSGGLYTLQRSLPRLLQLRCNQAIVGVASGIATLCQRCFVLGLLQLQLGDAPSVLVLVSQHALGLLSRLNRHRRNGAQYLGRDYPVYALAAEAEAMSPLPRRHVQLVAPVNWQGIAAGVGNAEPTATACATDEAPRRARPPRPDFVSPTLP